MRPVEALLLLVNLLTLVALAAPRAGARRWMRRWPPTVLVIVLVQILAEGSRWQMYPAYALALLFVLFWLRQGIAPADEFASQKRTHRIAAALGVALGSLALAASIALPMMIPVFRFPHPSGPYGIGTLTYHWVDAARPEMFSTNPAVRRELMVQIWYPATSDPSSPRAPYMADADAVTSAFAHIHQLPEFLFGHFKYVTTNAVSSAPAARDAASYPVLLFLEGVTGFRQMNTFQVEELVSHGYVVVAIDQPGAAAAVVFPDGRQAEGLAVAQLHAVIGPSYLPDMDVPLVHGRALPGNSLVPYLTQDVTFTLNQLTALNQADPNAILTGRLDLDHAGAFGFSLGGIVVGQACVLEPRLRACLVIDAAMPTDVVKAGVRQPSMWITRDADDMRLERQRAGGWPEAEIEAHHASMRAVYASLPGAGYFVQVPGTFHSNFMDLPNWFPLAWLVGLAGPIDGPRAHRIVNAYSLAFFDRHLKGRRPPVLDGSKALYPEVVFESRARASARPR